MMLALFGYFVERVDVAGLLEMSAYYGESCVSKWCDFQSRYSALVLYKALAFTGLPYREKEQHQYPGITI